jgi:hypothetical protein
MAITTANSATNAESAIVNLQKNNPGAKIQKPNTGPYYSMLMGCLFVP